MLRASWTHARVLRVAAYGSHFAPDLRNPRTVAFTVRELEVRCEEEEEEEDLFVFNDTV